MPTPAPSPARAPAAAAADWRIARRDFLRASTASLGGLALGALVPHPLARAAAAANGAPTAPTTPAAPRAPLRFGLLTDPHYADADAKGTRFYRESLGKVRAAVTQLRAERAAFLGVLGDVKDMAAGEPETRTLAHLVAIEAEIQRFAGPTYHVLGNHDMDNLSKPQFVAHVTNTGIAAGRSYYAFSSGGVRFVVLDATYDKNGRDYDHGKFDWRDANLPAAQLDWLATELAATREPVIVFVHQRLDGEGDASIRNRTAARALLEASGKVLAVFQGHDHAGGHSLINGIHYYTLRAVVEGTGETSNAFALVEVAANLDLTVTGYHRAVSLTLPRRG